MTFTLDSPAAELDQSRQHARYLRLRIARAEQAWIEGRCRDRAQWRAYTRALRDELVDVQLRIAQMEEA